MNKKRLLQVSIAASIAAILLIPGNTFVVGQVPPDTTAPSVSIAQPIAGASLNTANVTVTGTASDNVNVTSVEIFLDNVSKGNAVLTPTNATSVSWSMTLALLAQGAHSVMATAKDNASNTHSASVNFVVDTSPPSIRAPLPITVQANTAGGAFSTHPSIIAFLAGALTLDAIDPSPTVTNNAPALFPLGITTVTFTSTDDAGNSASDSSTVTVVDTILPSVTITQPLNGAKLNTTGITVSGTVSDATVTSVEILVDNISQGNAALNNTAWTKALTLAQGSHTITAKAKDGANNTSSTSISVIMDATAPTVSITSPANNANLNTSNVGITGTAADANGIASVHVSIDNGLFTLASGTTSWSFSATFANGTHTITAKATDMAGNTNKANVTITVRTLTGITITSPVNGAKLNSTNVTITGTVNDPSNVQSVKVSIDAGMQLPASFNITSGIWKSDPATLAQGNHTAKAILTNLANNTAIATVSFIVDTTPPLVSITSPTNNAIITTTSVKINGTASDANGVALVVVSIDNGQASTASFDAATGKWTLQTTLANGTHTIKATAKDIAGNKAMASVSVTLQSTTGGNQAPVPNQAQATQNLITMTNAMNLPKGVKTSLTAPLKGVAKILNDNNPNNDAAACGKLTAFINQVNAKKKNGSLTEGQMDQLKQFANIIKGDIKFCNGYQHEEDGVPNSGHSGPGSAGGSHEKGNSGGNSNSGKDSSNDTGNSEKGNGGNKGKGSHKENEDNDKGKSGGKGGSEESSEDNGEKDKNSAGSKTKGNNEHEKNTGAGNNGKGNGNGKGKK